LRRKLDENQLLATLLVAVMFNVLAYEHWLRGKEKLEKKGTQPTNKTHDSL